MSLWFKQERASIRGQHLLRVGQVLGIPVEALDRPLPGEAEAQRHLRSAYLWDHLYPELSDFAVAVGRREPQAVARLVQVDGIYAAAKLIGRSAWTGFDDYKRFIHPARRRQLEGLVRWHAHRTTS